MSTVYTQQPLFVLSKVCTKCKIDKPFSEFYTLPTNKAVRDYKKSKSPDIIPSGISSKFCTGCMQEKPLDDFHKSKSGKYGRVVQCKTCHQQQYQETYVPKPRRKKVVVPIESKVCNVCHVEKSIEKFGKSPRNRNGYKTECNQCSSKRHRGYHHRNRQEVIANPMIGSKVCLNCNEAKSFEDFNIVPTKKDRHDNLCKVCRNKRTKAYEDENKERIYSARSARHRTNPERRNRRERARYAENIDKSRQIHIAKKLRNPERYKNNLRKWNMLTRIKRHEKQRERYNIERRTIVGEICYDRIIERDGLTCYICSQVIDPTTKNRNSKLSFDHVTPLQPRNGEPYGTHTEDNIKPTHMVCNARKGNRPFETMTPHQRRGPDA